MAEISISKTLRKLTTLVENLRMQRTLDLKYQDGGDKLQNLIADITVMMMKDYSYPCGYIHRCKLHLDIKKMLCIGISAL